EGVSPRLRLTREGLALLGVPQNHVLKHSCPRLIYGVRLARNAFEYLRGEEESPRYVFAPDQADRGTRAIIVHWMTRRLLPRSPREETRQRLRRSRETTCS